jgi:hypothetical protein
MQLVKLKMGLKMVIIQVDVGKIKSYMSGYLSTAPEISIRELYSQHRYLNQRNGRFHIPATLPLGKHPAESIG